jgi:hypothetical protein
MTKLKLDDRNRLVQILESLPLLQTHRGRYQMLESSGLERVLPQIDLEGQPFIVISEIVDVLSTYGRVSYEHEALGMFLNRVKEFLGASDDKRDFIETLLKHYDLMTPAKTQSDLSDWKGSSDSEEFLEKIIGENTLRHISFLKRGLEVSRSVALIDYREWTGTGFMVSPNLLITNNHVLPNKDVVLETVFRFNYQLTFDGVEEKAREYRALSAGIFRTNVELDYTIVELEGPVGNEWAIAPLLSALPEEKSRVNIIQHPAGLPKQISFQNNFVEYADSTRIQYLTSTLGGSSGSPVFNDNWQVIAVHHAGGMLLEPRTGRRYFRNEGIAIGAIVKDLPQEIRNQIAG